MAEREFKGDEFPLAELIDALGRQLGRAREWANDITGRSGRPFIAWTTAQIEVGVTWTRSAQGGIDVKVLHLGGERTKENTTTMTVTLEPAGDESRMMP
jgi:Trypsin-co-occurring domain 2